MIKKILSLYAILAIGITLIVGAVMIVHTVHTHGILKTDISNMIQSDTNIGYQSIMQSIDDELQNDLIQLSYILCVMLLFVFAIIYILIIKPMNNIISIINNTDTDGLPKSSIPLTGISQIKLLSNAINGMMDKIKYTQSMLQEQTKQLKSSKSKYKTLLHLASDGVFYMDIDGKLIEYSNTVQKLLGYTTDEMQNLSVYDWDKDITYQQYKNIIDMLSDEPISIERVHTRKDNTTYIAQITATKVMIEDTLYIYASARDITHTKQLEANLLELNKNLEYQVNDRLNELREKEQLLIQQSKLASMGEMIGIIAHQWRQPLNIIAIQITALVYDYFSDALNDEKIQKFENDINTKIKYMSNTIDDFRNFFMPSKHKIDFNLLESITNVISIISSQLTLYKINLQIRNNNQSDIIVNGYPNEFKQVIINILNNAKDAIANKQSLNTLVDGHITIELSYDTSINKAQIDITDNGGGIPNDVIDNIFKPYFTTKSLNEGTGIGLYMSKIIIEKNMLGHISVCNVKDGARFSIVL